MHKFEKMHSTIIKSTCGKLAALFAGVCVAAVMPSFAEVPDAWLDYVEATGSQYVNIQVEAKRGTKIEYKGTFHGNSNGANMLLGARASGNGILITVQNNNGKIGFCGCETGLPLKAAETEVYALTAQLSTDGKATVRLGSSGTTEGVYTLSKDNARSSDTGQNFFLFSGNNGGSENSAWRTSGKCRSLKIWQDTDGDPETDYELVRDFRPCIEDGRAGLYDAVSETIFYSATGSNLVAGGAARGEETPDEHLEYVQSTGAGTQYLDTGVVARRGTKVEYKGTYTDGIILIGARQSSGGSLITFAQNVGGSLGMSGITGSGLELFSWNCRTIVSEVAADTGFPSITVKHADGSTETKTGNSSVIDATPAVTYPLYLFECNVAGGASSSYKSAGRCYGLKIWQTDERGEYRLVRDFVPCIDGGEGAFYDTVNREIRKSSGSAAFLAGPVVADGGADKMLEYVEATGSQLVDTGIIAVRGTKTQYEGTYTSGIINIGARGSATTVTFMQNMNSCLGMSGFGNSGLTLFSSDWRTIVSEVAADTGTPAISVKWASGGEESATGTGTAIAATPAVQYSLAPSFAFRHGRTRGRNRENDNDDKTRRHGADTVFLGRKTEVVEHGRAELLQTRPFAESGERGNGNRERGGA